MWTPIVVEKSTTEPVAIATDITSPTVKAAGNVDLMKIGENLMFMALMWQSAMLNILMTPPKKPKKTAEIINIKR